MTIRNLQYLLRPKAVALIGASKRPSSIGAVVARNLLRGGFDGPVMPVNPRHRAIEGVLTYPDVASLPVTPDLAVVATPPDTVPGLVAELAGRGTRGVVVITAGFGEGGAGHGRELRQQMLDAARPALVRVVGPNCLGVIVPGVGLNASFVHRDPLPGHLAFVTQSGAIVTSVVDWAADRGVGFSHLVSLGDMADVDFGDMLDYLANDAHTRAVLLYVEAVTDARKFMSAARAAARSKHVIVVKSGRHAESARAAASHTGSLAGSDEVYDAAFRRAGMLRVQSLEELFAAVETLAHLIPPKGDRLAILTNGGGIGVMATDDLLDRHGRLAELAPETVARLDEVLPPTWSRGNPVDLIGDAPGSRYRDALEVVMTDPGVDAVLVLNCPTAVTPVTEAAEATLEVAKKHRKTLLTSWVGGGTAETARRIFATHRIPTYETPKQAILAFLHMVEYRRNQEMLTETPPSIPEHFTPDVERARASIAAALADGREMLTEPESKDILQAYGIPVVPTRVVATPAEAGQAAAEIAAPVVVKILSRQISHKSDVGGVALGLDPAEVADTAAAMQARVAARLPEARIDGFAVQPFVRRPKAFELIVGVVEDEQFGPVILFGQGGTAAEVLRDKALALPPLNMHLAYEVMSRTRVHRLLQGYRELPAADLEAIALVLVKISQLVIDHAEIKELDVNPLLADGDGVTALDARIRVAPATRRLAIRPYPKQLEEDVTLEDGRRFWVRPVVPEDEPAFQRNFARLTPEEIRLRFLAPIRQLSHVAAARFTQLDYDREMALVLTEPGQPGTTEIFGVAQIAADPDNETAEYAIIVQRDLTGLGLGRHLMERIIEVARKRGITELWGDVLRENAAMRGLCKRLGFKEHPEPDDATLVRVRLALSS
jgi:acetyltransferase